MQKAKYSKNIHNGDFPGVYFSAAVDEYDHPVERTKQEYPYSFDGYVTHRMGKNEEAMQPYTAIGFSNGTMKGLRLYKKSTLAGIAITGQTVAPKR